MDILGIAITHLTRNEISDRLHQFLAEPKFHRITTVNPEFLLRAEKDEAFHQALLDADLRVADGFGIVLAGLWHGKRITRFPGADLMTEILRIANEKKLSVYLAVRADGLSTYEEIRTVLQKKYPDLKINGADIDSKIHDPQFMIHNSITFCNFGAPEQEIFLDSLKDQNGIRLALGVGGAFDYLTGKQKRAPRWLRTIGLEWCWRLMQQPKRWRRIWNAVVVFPFRVLSATIQK